MYKVKIVRLTIRTSSPARASAANSRRRRHLPNPNNALLRAAVDEHRCVKPGWQTRDVQLDGSAYLSHNHAIFRSDERELLQPHPNLTRVDE